MLTLPIKGRKGVKEARVQKATRAQRDTKVTREAKAPKGDAPTPVLQGGKDTPKGGKK